MADTTNTVTYLAQRLHERSTYLMLPILLSLAGTHVSDDTIQVISNAGIVLSGLLLVLIPQSNAQRTTTVLTYLSQRLQEPATYAAIPVLLGLIGIHASNTVLQQVGQIGIVIGGMLAALLADRKPPAVSDTSTSASSPSETAIPVIAAGDTTPPKPTV